MIPSFDSLDLAEFLLFVYSSDQVAWISLQMLEEQNQFSRGLDENEVSKFGFHSEMRVLFA